MTDGARAGQAVTSVAAADVVQRVVANLELAIRAPRATLELCVLCLLAEGHLIIEDFPGVGKTMLAKSLARSLDISFSRLQFTPDLLPTDVTVSTCSTEGPTSSSSSQAGFCQRPPGRRDKPASPKTKSACSRHEEGRSRSTATRLLELPFVVLANAESDRVRGTYPLPEAQLDRSPRGSRSLSHRSPRSSECSRNRPPHRPSNGIVAVADRAEVLDAIGALLARSHVEESGGGIRRSIPSPHAFECAAALGASPRAGIALLRMAKPARSRRPLYVLPRTSRPFAVPVLAHRLIVAPEARATGWRRGSRGKRHFAEVPVRHEALGRAFPSRRCDGRGDRFRLAPLGVAGIGSSSRPVSREYGRTRKRPVTVALGVVPALRSKAIAYDRTEARRASRVPVGGLVFTDLRSDRQRQCRPVRTGGPASRTRARSASPGTFPLSDARLVLSDFSGSSQWFHEQGSPDDARRVPATRGARRVVQRGRPPRR